MKLLIWSSRAFLFLILLALAMANTQEASLKLFTGTVWQAPLILIGLAFFSAGVLAAWILILPSRFRARIEIARLKRELKQAKQAKEASHESPLVPLV